MRLNPGPCDIPFDKRVRLARSGILDTERSSSALVESMLQFVAERWNHTNIIPSRVRQDHLGRGVPIGFLVFYDGGEGAVDYNAQSDAVAGESVVEPA